MDKNAIKKYAIWARRELISRVSQKALQYGISAEEHGNPDADNVNGRILTPVEQQQRRSLIQKINADGYEQAMEEAAYTWFNRFTALRYMEVNGYLPSHVRVFTNEENAFKPQIIAEAIHLDPEDFEDGLDMEQIYAFKDANDTEGLYKYLLIMQCNAFQESLPGMFTSIMDFTVLLFPDNLLREGSVIEQMISMIPEEDWKDQVQIIGWLYQYYNSEKKDAVFAAMSQKIKVSKENIAPATQLFTPDWIVRYMVENSLGRLWVDGHPDTTARADWKYYLEEAEQTPEVQAQLAEIRESRKDLTPEQIRFIDPCMGSGHILVYAFDVLMQIYLSYGYSEREAAESIVRNNLWGLDLDKRAYQLAYFAVMMKGRQYDRRFLKKVIKPNLAHFQDLPKMETSLLDEPIRSFVEQFENADTYGSLITVQADEKIDKAIDEFQPVLGFGHAQLEQLMQLYKILSQKYDVVCTNPPYMGNGPELLAEYLLNNYTEEKYDLYAAFILKCLVLSKVNGYSAMITGESWMFLPSFDRMRNNLIINKSLVNMAHMGFGAFDAGFGTTSFIIMNNNINGYKTSYERLADTKDADLKIHMLLSYAIKERNPIVIDNDTLKIIEGTPWAYWMKESVLQSFENSNLSKYAVTKAGIVTGNNDFFIHFWYEVEFNSIDFNSVKDKSKFSKWVPAHKGGGSNKFYGNQDYIMRLKDLWSERFYTNNMRRGDIDFYFSEGITWSTLSNKLAFRHSPYGFVYETKGSMCFVQDDNKRLYCLGLLNSSLCNYILNILCPTLDYNRSSLLKLPCIISKEKMPQINTIVAECIEIAKEDWDSFETSWDFKKHPFIRSVATIKEAYEQWAQECNDRRAKLKANEEELNRIFIEIYGLQDELTPEVEDKDITVRAADLQRDMRSFVSYAVGCMFGRYSLDTEGLAYAGGEWDESKYQTFIPDKDNIIPICDDDYLSDDITLRFVEFVRTVFGEDTLEENLQFIASALGGKGTARDVIRSYFLNGFYADHCKIYQKRPIYWLFDSGKKNGFKALIYLHRYQPDTIARVRTGYVHELQARYRTAIEDLEKRVESASGSEAVKLKKALTKITDQADELMTYEEAVHHLADQMIKIDLDDGVKQNYAVFKDVLAKLK